MSQSKSLPVLSHHRNVQVLSLLDILLLQSLPKTTLGTVRELVDLACIYYSMFAKVVRCVSVLQEHLDNGSLHNIMKHFCLSERRIAQDNKNDECPCVTWFLNQVSPESFIVPNRYRATYDIWETAMESVIESLNLTHWIDDNYKLDEPKVDVFCLYLAIQPNIWLIPDVYSASWLKFGFCYCKSFSQRAELARHYLRLASSSATFDEIVSAYETSSLAGLTRSQGIDISGLEK